MNLITQAYDADVYQLVPKVATFKMQDDGVSSLQETHDVGQWNECGGFSIRYSESCYTAMLAAAPQPPELSPWLPIDDFLSSEIFGVVWVKTKDDIRLCNHKALGMFVGVLTCALFTKREVTHVILLERPQAPEGEKCQ